MKETITARIEIGRSIDSETNVPQVYWFARSSANDDFPRGFDLLVWTRDQSSVQARIVRKFQLHGMDYIGESISAKQFTPEQNAAYMKNFI